MEIRVHGPGPGARGRSRSRCARPGNDFELAVGFCLTEGLLDSRRRPRHRSPYCLAGEGEQEYNVVTVKVAAARSTWPVTSGSFVANASCGLCGKTTLDEVEQQLRAGRPPVRSVARSVLAALPDRLRDAQTVFDATGGLHAAARFTADGELVALREDVGRHNALDKLVGHALLERHAAARRRRAHGLGPGELRDRAEGGDGRHPGARARCRRRRASRSTPRDRFGQTLVGLPPRRARQRLHPPRTHRPRALSGQRPWPGRPPPRSSRPSARKRDLWVGFKPYGIGETKPNHYKRHGQDRLGEPRNLPYAWRILQQGRVRRLRARRRRLPRLDALRRAPLHDPAQPAAHQHDGRARPLAARRRRSRCKRLRNRELRDLGRLPYPMVRRAGEPGFTRVSWDEALDLIADRIRATTPDRARGLPHRTRHHQRGVLRRAEGHPVPRHQQRRQRGPRLPRAVDHRAEEDDRRRGHHVLVHRRDRQRPHRAVRRQRRQRASRSS